MRALAFALVVAGGPGLAGCGASDEDRIREAFDTYRDAFVQGDGERACTQLTGKGRREFATSIAAKTCPEAVAKARKALSKDEFAEFRALRVERVKVDGDRGVMTLNAQPDELASGWRMVKEGDSWLLG